MSKPLLASGRCSESFSKVLSKSKVMVAEEFGGSEKENSSTVG